jgi:hypothetical protein
MIQRIGIALACFFIFTAQAMLPGFPPGVFASRTPLDASGGAPAFSGPGDAVSGAAMYWSCTRAYNAAYATGAGTACDIQRVSDSAVCTTKFAVTGFLDQTTTYCTSNTQTIVQFCNATTCGVQKMYDQSGQTLCRTVPTEPCYVTQPTQANQPILSLSCLSSKPCVQFTAASSLSLVGSFTVNTLALPYTLTGVAKSTGSPSVRGTLIGFDSVVLMSLDRGGVDNAEINCGTQVTNTALDSTWHALLGSCSSSASSMNVDGVDSSSLTQSTDITGTDHYVGQIGAGQYAQANVTELGVWPISFLAGSKNTAMCQNMQAAYGSGNFGAAC